VVFEGGTPRRRGGGGGGGAGGRGDGLGRKVRAALRTWQRNRRRKRRTFSAYLEKQDFLYLKKKLIARCEG